MYDGDNAMEGAGSHPRNDRRPAVGTTLLRFSEERRWSDQALAQFLGCDASGLARLALLRCPDLGMPNLEAWIAETAAHAGCLPDRLAAILIADGRTPQ